MKKILFTDLDGTLLNNESKIFPEMKQALDDMIAAGNTLVLASGRPLNSILEVKENAGISYPGMYITANNGSLIYDCDAKKSIYEIRVSLDDVSKVWELAASMQVHIQTYTEDSIIVGKDDEETQFYRRKIHLPLIISDNPLKVLSVPPYKLLAIDLHDKNHLVQFADAIREMSGNRLSTIFSSDTYLEVFNSTAGKGRALQWLCDYLSIPVADSIASGDAENDLSMLKAAGLSVAMCNGSDILKEQADVITARSNHENGLSDIIHKYML
ncbi:MAG: Cof-type HAD-IIB family hydrolase [Lachnospiraceae bacterium]